MVAFLTMSGKLYPRKGLGGELCPVPASVYLALSTEGPPYGPVGRLCEACSGFRLSDDISLHAASYHWAEQVSSDSEEESCSDVRGEPARASHDTLAQEA